MAAIVGRTGSVVIYVGENETLKLSDKLPHVTTFSVPNSEGTEVDVTDFDSTGKEIETGLLDYGELQVTQHLNDNEYEVQQTRVEEATDVYFAYYIKNKAGNIIVGRTGKGIVKTVTIDGAEMDSAMTVQTTIKVNGKMTKSTEEPTA